MLGLVLMAVNRVAGLVLPASTKYLVDYVIGKHRTQLLTLIALAVPGATWVQGTINGMGERAGNANLGEVALTLRALYGVESKLPLDRITDASERVRARAGYETRPWKARTRRAPSSRPSAPRAAMFQLPGSGRW